MRKLLYIRYRANARAQQGMVLLITLLVLVAMMLVSIGMLRSVDTSVAAVGNLALRQAAEAPVNYAVERAMEDIAQAKIAAGSGVPVMPDYYSLVSQHDNEKGIPADLQSQPAPGASGVLSIQQGDFTISAVVQRMCTNTNAPTSTNCMLVTKGGSVGPDDTHMDGEVADGGAAGGGGGSGTAAQRITIRVDGPKSSTVFAQAFLQF